MSPPPPVLALGALLALLIGVILGMLGGGGAILTLPMLVYALHVEPRAAIATSLFVVGATSLVGATVHARAGAVRWRAAAPFGGAAIAGALAGGRLGHLLPAGLLLLLFAAIMLVTAVAMLRGRDDDRGPPASARVLRSLALGGAVGVLAGLVGAGGGFLIVPALTLYGGLSIRDAIGTSLVVIALQSFAGFAGQLSGVTIDWPLTAIVTGASVAGVVGGGFLGRRVAGAKLRRAFAWLVLVMGLFVIAKQTTLTITAVATLATAMTVFFVTRRRAPPGEKACTTSHLSPR